MTATPGVFYVGHRPQEILGNLFGKDFAGGLISDGDIVYRDSLKRRRRKARSLDQEARRFGRKTPARLKTLMAAVYRARKGPGEGLTPRYQKALAEFRARCGGKPEAAHEKTRAVEFLNEGAAIFRGPPMRTCR